MKIKKPIWNSIRNILKATRKTNAEALSQVNRVLAMKMYFFDADFENRFDENDLL